ncbi:uncharacterized protein METZ01_LOCUS245493, partial [marine metagenome]
MKFDKSRWLCRLKRAAIHPGRR